MKDKTVTRQEMIALLDEKAALEKLRQQQIATLQACIKEILSITDERYDELEEAIYEAEEHCGVYLGHCESCNTALFEGDKGSYFDDAGLFFCEEHTQTFGDAIKEFDSVDKSEWDSYFPDQDAGFAEEAYASWKSRDPKAKMSSCL